MCDENKNENKIIKSLPPLQCIQNFPYVDESINAINDWQLLQKVWAKCNEVVDLSNLTQKEQQDLYNYVSNYFTNLDVQEEIDKKLDEMVESGELGNIISAYINNNLTRIYENVSEMKSDTGLIANMKVKTLGYYKSGDTGGAYYIIRDVATENSLYEILNNNKYAILIIENELHACQIGCHGDGSIDDSDNLQKGINYCINNNLTFVASKQNIFLIEKTINIATSVSTELNFLNLDFHGATIKASDTSFASENNCIIYINNVNNFYTDKQFKKISNLVLDCSWINVENAIKVDYIQRCSIEYINIINYFNIAINAKGGFEVYYQNIFLSAYRGNNNVNVGNTIGLLVNTADCVFNNITSIDAKTFIYANRSSTFSKCHAWIANCQLLKNSVFYYSNTNLCGFLYDCFADTYETVFFGNNRGSQVKCDGLKTFFNTNFGEINTIIDTLNCYLFKQKEDDLDYIWYWINSALVNSQIAWEKIETLPLKLTNSNKKLLAHIDRTNSIWRDNVEDAESLMFSKVTETTNIINTISNNIITAVSGITSINFSATIIPSNIKNGENYLGYIRNNRVLPADKIPLVITLINPSTGESKTINGSLDGGNISDTQYYGAIRMTKPTNIDLTNFTNLFINDSIYNYQYNSN